MTRTPGSAQQGFTLIEVLVAGVILFAAIATATQVFQNALTAQSRASELSGLQGVIPSMRSQIGFELRQGETRGEGRNGRYHYSWSSEIQRSRRPAIRIDPEFGEDLRSDQRLHENRVTLLIGTSEQEQQRRRYQWTELTWSGQ